MSMADNGDLGARFYRQCRFTSLLNILAHASVTKRYILTRLYFPIKFRISLRSGTA